MPTASRLANIPAIGSDASYIQTGQPVVSVIQEPLGGGPYIVTIECGQTASTGSEKEYANTDKTPEATDWETVPFAFDPDMFGAKKNASGDIPISGYPDWTIAMTDSSGKLLSQSAWASTIPTACPFTTRPSMLVCGTTAMTLVKREVTYQTTQPTIPATVVAGYRLIGLKITKSAKKRSTAAWEYRIEMTTQAPPHGLAWDSAKVR